MEEIIEGNSDLIMDDEVREVDKADGIFSDYLPGKKPKKVEEKKKVDWGDEKDMDLRGDNDFIPDEPSKEFFGPREGKIVGPPAAVKPKQGFSCSLCGKVCKSLTGRMAHERNCKKKGVI